MKKVILIITVFLTSLAVDAQSTAQTIPAKSKSYYSFAWGLFKSKDYPQNKTAVVKVKKPKISTCFANTPLDTAKYEKKSVLWGTIQWTKNKKLHLLKTDNLLIANAQNNDHWLNKNYHEVSIDATNKDFSDLLFLKKELEGKNIVAIGEQTHDDGSSFEGRNRLIQFLISELDYDVILFESGMFDVNFADQLYNNTKNIDSLTKSLFNFWRDAAQNQSLFTFIDSQKKQGKQIYFDGFDCKFTSKYRLEYVDYIDSVVNNYDPATKENNTYIEYLKVLKYISNAKGIKSALPKISTKDMAIFKQGTELVLKILEGKDDFAYQMIKSNYEGVLLYANHSLLSLMINKKKLIQMNNQRDVIMAENLNFLLENKYKNKKVILFGATYHFIKNNQTIQRIGKFPLPIESSKIMVNLLTEKLQKSLYAIGFTAYSGKYGMVKDTTKGSKIEPAKEGSLEKKLFDYKAENGIITLNTTDKKPDWFHNNLSIRLFRYESNTACNDWSKVLDAVFFIKEMKPIRDISKKQLEK